MATSSSFSTCTATSGISWSDATADTPPRCAARDIAGIMALLGMQDVTLAFGGSPVLADASFAIDRGERVCLLGRNGAGKSTVMKLLDGTIRPDGGEIVRQTGLTVTRLEQDIPKDVAGTTFDVVAAGLGDAGDLLARYHRASHRVATDH